MPVPVVEVPVPVPVVEVPVPVPVVDGLVPVEVMEGSLAGLPSLLHAASPPPTTRHRAKRERRDMRLFT